MAERSGGTPPQPPTVLGPPTEISVARYYSGPLPPAHEVAEYEAVLPGAFDRLLSMTERQAAHRQARETKVVDVSLRMEERGQWIGFVLALLGILASTLLVVVGKSLEGLAALLAAVAALVGVFVRQKRARESEVRRRFDPAVIGTSPAAPSAPIAPEIEVLE